MTNIFPIDFEEKNTMAPDDYVLFSDSEDGNKIKKAQYQNLKGEKGDKGDKGDTGNTGPQGPQGIQGPQGVQGEKGDAATIEVGTVTTGEPGTDVSVVNSGTEYAAVLDFTIPQGAKGDTGDKGDKGDKGDTGTAATISVGTTTTGDAGTSASVTNSGTSSAAIFDFTIPKGEKGDTGATGSAATITIGSTTTGEPGTSASVTNSGTSSAAIFDFTIPEGEKGDKGDTGTAATITVGSTTTGDAGTSASVVNSGTSSAAVLDFTIPKGDKGDTGNTGATGNGIASVTSSKSGKVTTVTITETDGDVSSFTVSDGEDGEGAGDVLGPASSTDGNVVLFNGATGKIIKDSGKTLPSVIDSLTSTSTTDALSANQGKELKDLIDTYTGLGRFLSLWNSATGQPMSFPLDIPYTYNTGDRFMVEVVSSANPPVNYMPNGSSYTGTASTTQDTTNNVEQRDVYIYDGTSWLFQKNNEIEVSFADIAGSPSDNTNLANALSAKQDSLTLPATPTQGNLVVRGADNETLADGGAIPTTPSKATSSALGTIKLGSDTVQSVSAEAVSGTANRTYAIQLNSSDQAVVNVPRTDTTYSRQTPASGGTTLSLVNTGDMYTWNNKQNALSVQTAYTTKGTSTKVPTITTNSLGQVTAITETNITYPVSDASFSSSWDGDTTNAPSKNAVYDVLGDVETLLANI